MNNPFVCTDEFLNGVWVKDTALKLTEIMVSKQILSKTIFYLLSGVPLVTDNSVKGLEWEDKGNPKKISRANGRCMREKGTHITC